MNHAKLISFLNALITLTLMSPVAAQNFQKRSQNADFEIVKGTNGVAVADYDRDGDLDVYFVVKDRFRANRPSTWNRLFANLGNGSFQDMTPIAGIAGRDSSTISNPTGMGQKMGASWGDYNNDGWPDIFLTHFGPDQLYRNNSDGTFTDVTTQAGLAGGKVHLSSSALWFDYDRDGDLDLYVSTYGDYSGNQDTDRRNRLYENIGNEAFLDVTEASGAGDSGATWTTIAFDANGDGHFDLYLANDFGPNTFYLNNGDKTFSEKTSEFGLEDEFHGMGLAVSDCDGNGLFDVYLTNITEAGSDVEINPLFLNTGQNFFTNGSVDAGVSLAGWGWGTEFFDLENDGDDDLVVATGNFQADFVNELFVNKSTSDNPVFSEISHASGIADSQAARGVVTFDYDKDGDSDLLISNFFEIPALYENITSQGNWLKVELEGVSSNRFGIGGVITVQAEGKRISKYNHGAQFLGQSILPVHFGLGSAQMAERIEVLWPSGEVDVVENVEINQTIHLRERFGLVTDIAPSFEIRQVEPETLRFLGQYPNPFNHATRFQILLRESGDVELLIINIRGEIIKKIHKVFSNPGQKTISWDGTDLNARPVSSGIYFYRLRAGRNSNPDVTGRMLLLK